MIGSQWSTFFDLICGESSPCFNGCDLDQREKPFDDFCAGSATEKIGLHIPSPYSSSITMNGAKQLALLERWVCTYCTDITFPVLRRHEGRIDDDDPSWG